MTSTLQWRHLILGPLQTNCFLVADGETGEAVVIDPADEAQRILAALAEQRWRLRYILLTHAHFDHFSAAAAVVEATGAKVGLHPLDEPLLRADGGAPLWGLSLRPCPPPQLTLTEGQELAIGAHHLTVLHVPGHSPGHTAFYSAEMGILFGGDVLFKRGVGRTDLWGGDYIALQRSLKEKLFTLPDDTIVHPGHGEFTTIGDEKRSYRFLDGEYV